MSARIAPSPRDPVEIPDRPSVSPKKRAELFLAAGGRCEKCAVKIIGPYEIDHDIQRWLNGDDSDANLQVLCVPCHRKKSAEDAGIRAKVRGMAKLNLANPRTVSATPIRSAGFRPARRLPAPTKRRT